MNGMELDQAMRKIMLDVTRETAFSAARKLVDLGFPALMSMQMVSDIVLAKEKK